MFFFFFQAEDGIRDLTVTGVQTCALPISGRPRGDPPDRRAAAPRRPEAAPRRQAVQAVSADLAAVRGVADEPRRVRDDQGRFRPRPLRVPGDRLAGAVRRLPQALPRGARDRKSTRLNSSHSQISYAVFCLKKKKQTQVMYPHTTFESLPSSAQTSSLVSQR